MPWKVRGKEHMLFKRQLKLNLAISDKRRLEADMAAASLLEMLNFRFKFEKNSLEFSQVFLFLLHAVTILV